MIKCKIKEHNYMIEKMTSGLFHHYSKIAYNAVVKHKTFEQLIHNSEDGHDYYTSFFQYYDIAIIFFGLAIESYSNYLIKHTPEIISKKDEEFEKKINSQWEIYISYKTSME